MVRKSILFGTLLAAALSLSGCDFIRTVAGRPTSAEIEVKRQALVLENERREKEEAARIEETERKAREAAGLAQLEGIEMKKVSELKVAFSSLPSRKYSIIMGAFSSSENASRLVSRINEAGYAAELLPYRSGINAVAACPSDDLPSLGESFGKLRGEPFCPQDAWILVNE